MNFIWNAIKTTYATDPALILWSAALGWFIGAWLAYEVMF